VSDAIPQDEALRLWLCALVGNEPSGGLFEIRGKPAGGVMRRVGFVPIEEGARAATLITRAARVGDVWVGAAPRREVFRLRDHKRSGGLDAIERCWTLWVDADTPEACAAVREHDPPASMIVGSGSGVHAYFSVRRPLTPADAKRANRRLAYALGADLNACDGARVMRPPGTANWKTNPPAPVLCERLELVSYDAGALVRHLPDPPRKSRPTVRPAFSRSGPAVLDGLLREVRRAAEGERNAKLFWAACRVGEHVLRHEVDVAPAIDSLRAAAVESGLDDFEIERTVDSALARSAVMA
jgi:RepB DNA-primase from phage plasmid